MRLKLTTLFICLALAGCATQTIPVDNQEIIAQDQLKRDYTIDTQWWKIYGDEQLNRLVDQALANNTDLKQSAIKVNRALYQANLLGQDLVPEFSADAGAGFQKNLQKNATTHNYSAGIGVSYEVDLWQRLSKAASAQEWEYKATEADLESVRLTIINQVVDQYFHLLYLNKAIATTKENVAFYEKIQQIMETKYKYGKEDESAPLNAQKSVLSAKDSLTNLQTRHKEVEQVLRELLNLRPDEKLEISDVDILKMPLSDVDLNVPIAALGLRPDVKAAEYRIQSAFQDWESVKASVYPSITLGSTLDVSSDKSSTLFDVPFLAGNVKINLPFLQWNKLKWNIKISEADFESAKLNLESAINTALNEVDTYYYSYEKSKQLYANTQKRFDNDVKISQYNRKRYEVGTYELKEWLEVKCTENQTYLSLLEAKYNTLNYENAIYQAMGARLTATQAPVAMPVVQEQTTQKAAE